MRPPVTPILLPMMLLTSAEGLAQPNGEPGQATTDPVTIQVTSPRLDRSLYDSPMAMNIEQGPELREGRQGLQIDEVLGTVPGLYFQNRYNFAQNLRLSMRGFGARAPFGVRGIHLRVDGIPYTLPDGQAQVDAIDMDSLERIEVIRGPSSVLYGNAAGGVIDITTLTGREQPPGTRLRLDGGSDGYQKARVQTNVQRDRLSASSSLSWLDYQGYRDQSEVEKGLLNTRLNYQWDNGRSLTTTLNLLELPTAEDPGGLTRAQAEADRQQASFMAGALDAGQDVAQQTLGLQLTDPASLPGTLTTSGFVSQRDFRQQLPFPGPSLIDYQRLYYGGSVQYQQALEVAGTPFTLGTGADLGRQQDDRSRFIVSSDREVTARTQREDQTATALGLFVQGDVEWRPAFTTSAGLRYDYLKLAIDDRWLTDDEDGSGSRTFEEVSGMLGFSYRPRDRQQVYGNIGTAFETPTFTEFARPDGSSGFNTALEPQETLSRELGFRSMVGSDLELDLALFSARVRNEILPFESGGRTFYENAGRTDRNGVELGLAWTPSWHWKLDSALTLADYELERFRDNEGNRLDGNRMPGLPRQQWVNNLRWRGDQQQFLAIETLFRGKVYAENSNQTEVESYWLVHLRGGKSFRLGRTELELFAGIRNLLDEKYFSNIRINANSDRPDPADRGYFEPAPERHFQAGVEVSF